jgi:hypothetical protein
MHGLSICARAVRALALPMPTTRPSRMECQTRGGARAWKGRSVAVARWETRAGSCCATANCVGTGKDAGRGNVNELASAISAQMAHASPGCVGSSSRAVNPVGVGLAAR